MHTFDELRGIVAKLRSEEGCPWDRERTFESLKKYPADKVEEVSEVVDNKSTEDLCEELEDVSLQVVSNSEVVNERGSFTIDDVINGICREMV